MDFTFTPFTFPRSPANELISFWVPWSTTLTTDTPYSLQGTPNRAMIIGAWRWSFSFIMETDSGSLMIQLMTAKRSSIEKLLSAVISRDQYPMTSFTRITWIRSVCLEYLVIRNWQQRVSGDLQSKHLPVSLHGVLTLNRCAFIGAATFLARFMALSRSEQTLFMPTIKITFFGPWAIQETRFEFPSMLTIIPSLVMAFALDKSKEEMEHFIIDYIENRQEMVCG